MWLFTGCVMDAWQRDIHRAAIAVLGACGAGVALPGAGRGLLRRPPHARRVATEAARLARRVMRAFPGSAPILVDSAGCGAALKDYGHLLGTREAERFSARVIDIHEWLAERADRLPPAGLRWPRPSHCGAGPLPPASRAAQRSGGPDGAGTATARSSSSTTTGRCCGAGGAYSALQPELAGRIRTQKLAVIAATTPDVVASANPGCGLWLAGGRRAGPASHGDRGRGGRPGRPGAERNPPVAGEFEDIRGRLLQISEELADLAIDRLRESIDAGGVELPVDERRLTRARRAVERAAAILAEPDDRDWEG